jgi:cytidyltransferase-like protein
MKIVLVTGGFDPLHSGHIACFTGAKLLGDRLVVGVNSDAWLARKKGQCFMPWHERASIIENLRMVDHVIRFDDTDNSAIDAIARVQSYWPNNQIIFANGGDRTADNIPEMVITDVEFVFGVGGGKTASSSDYLKRWLDASC